MGDEKESGVRFEEHQRDQADFKERGIVDKIDTESQGRRDRAASRKRGEGWSTFILFMSPRHSSSLLLLASSDISRSKKSFSATLKHVLPYSPCLLLTFSQKAFSLPCSTCLIPFQRRQDLLYLKSKFIYQSVSI